MDDVLLFGKTQKVIKEALNVFKGVSLEFTEERDVFSFLGVEVRQQEDGIITLLQGGLIEKIIKTVGLEDATIKHTPTETLPIGSVSDDMETKEAWIYPSVIGMIFYLSPNSRTDIQYAVHQCARFSHRSATIHYNTVKRIVRYLLGTKESGLIM